MASALLLQGLWSSPRMAGFSHYELFRIRAFPGVFPQRKPLDAREFGNLGRYCWVICQWLLLTISPLHEMSASQIFWPKRMTIQLVVTVITKRNLTKYAKTPAENCTARLKNRHRRDCAEGNHCWHEHPDGYLQCCWCGDFQLLHQELYTNPKAH